MVPQHLTWTRSTSCLSWFGFSYLSLSHIQGSLDSIGGLAKGPLLDTDTGENTKKGQVCSRVLNFMCRDFRLNTQAEDVKELPNEAGQCEHWVVERLQTDVAKMINLKFSTFPVTYKNQFILL